MDDLLCVLKRRMPLATERRGDYTSVRLATGGAIALFASDDRVAITVEPAKGYALQEQPEYRCQIPRTPVTTYVVITASDLARHFDAVVELAAESLQWRAAARDESWCARCGVGCATQRDACPNCWVEIDDDGKCLCPQPSFEVLAS